MYVFSVHNIYLESSISGSIYGMYMYIYIYTYYFSIYDGLIHNMYLETSNAGYVY